jgi:hypothetical protein
MAEPSLNRAEGIPCAQWSRTQRIDPVGTAGSHAGYVLVEWPLPWPRDAGDVQALGPVREVVAGRGFRVQLLVPETVRCRRIALYRRPPGPFTRFEGRELHVQLDAHLHVQPDAHVDAAGREDRGAPKGALDGAAIGDALGHAADRLLAGGGEPVGPCEVLLCTHGRRDRCCGSLGTRLWEQLRESGIERSGVRLARTSHTGGHRFAATCVVLPAGTAWGFLDPDAAHRVARGAGPLDDLLPRYRGCSGLDSPAAQALERAVLAEAGWPLLESARTVLDLGGGRLRLVASGPSGSRAWEATVVPAAARPVPDCGRPPGPSMRTETEHRVEDLLRLE